MGRLLALAAAAALAWAGAARAAAPQELTIPASDGTPLACGLVLPDGSPPAGGWPGLLLFHGLGETHAQMETLAETAFAPAGYASLACDARGTGASGGVFGLDGPRETQDARDLFAWLAARPDVSDTEIGAYGVSLGGGAVWNAAAAGVPFAAIVPAASWTRLASALAAGGVPKSALLDRLAATAPAERWDPALAPLLDGTPAKKSLTAPRSSRAALPSLTVPTLILQGRRDFLFDVDQALAAYRALAGPRRLYLGDLGGEPAANPPAEQPHVLAAVVAWFDEFLKGAPAGIVRPTIELAHDPWNGTTTVLPFGNLPKTHAASVTLPGSTPLEPGARATRSARITGGPHETFGAGSVTVRYADAAGWTHLVATVSVAGAATPFTLGAARVTRPAGVLTIPLLDEVATLPRGKRLVVTLGGTSTNDVFAQDVPPGASITIGRVTLKLPVGNPASPASPRQARLRRAWRGSAFRSLASEPAASARRLLPACARRAAPAHVGRGGVCQSRSSRR